MKRLAHIAFCLAGGGLVVFGAPVASPGGPYAVIVARNVFGLAPEPAPVVAVPAIAPPGVIKPNGIISLFGRAQVLFKAPGLAREGNPPAEKAYLLGEGERADGVAVVRIDAGAGEITFDNHGVVQTIALPAGLAADAPKYKLKMMGAIGHGRIPPEFIGADDEGGQPQIPSTRAEQIQRIEALRAHYRSVHDPRADTLPPTSMMPDPAAPESGNP